MINIVCWKWEPEGGLHPRKGMRFNYNHVNRLWSMLNRNLSSPFQLHCITDNPTGIRPQVKIHPLWGTYRDMGGCYIRLPIFGKLGREIIGPDFFSVDLDVVILDDITNLLESTRKNHDFKIWGDTNPTTPYNGSFFYMKAEARKQVIEEFHHHNSPILGKRKHYCGTDQAWIAVCLGENEAIFTKEDGIYSYRCDYQLKKHFDLYGDEKIVFFHGSHDPSKAETQRLVPWVEDHWR